MRILVGLTLAIGCLAGCSASPVVQQPSPGWIRSNGGTADGAQLAKIRSIGDRFLAVVERPFQLHVLQNDQPTALAWPSGDIFLTRGLVDILTDDEIAAVIGHELGHLLTDADIDPTAAVTGTNDDDSEIRADDSGLLLLDASHTPRESLRSALQKIVFIRDRRGAKSPQLLNRISRLP